MITFFSHCLGDHDSSFFNIIIVILSLLRKLKSPVSEALLRFGYAVSLGIEVAMTLVLLADSTH